MFCLILFYFSLVAVFLLLIITLAKSRLGLISEIKELRIKLNNLNQQEERLKEEIDKKDKLVREIATLYELSKEMCRFLDINKIFSVFKEGLSKLVRFEECLYFDKIGSFDDFVDFLVIPLAISDKSNFGYLAIKGLDKKDRPKLDILVLQFISALRRSRLYNLIRELAITDSLTKTFTHSYVLDRLNEELKRASQFEFSLACLMIDIDNFKSINDKYGHLVGDVVLKKVAEIIKNNCREIDLVGRFGGEEFIVILPMIDKDNAIVVAERIRKTISSANISIFDRIISVSVSIGLAYYPTDAKSSHEIIDKADWALYRAKNSGKDRVVAYARFD